MLTFLGDFFFPPSSNSANVLISVLDFYFLAVLDSICDVALALQVLVYHGFFCSCSD